MTGVFKKSKKKGVLRYVTGTIVVGDYEYELLECGHNGKLLTAIEEIGMFGIKPSATRRCSACKRAKK